MSERQRLGYGPNPARRKMVGFCDGCGRVLEPVDYLECKACYLRHKQAKRRYARATAQRQLECALERVQRLANEPLLCHWVPDAAILFGSMLDKDNAKVGDIDLCVIGGPAFRRGYATAAETRSWASANAPASASQVDRLFYPEKAAYSFIKKANTLLSLVLRQEFASVGGGRPFAYQILWARAGIDPAELRAEIDAARPRELAESIAERRDSVRSVLEHADRRR